ncbi:MAG: transporter substrate-binding protein [Betaproteobacteria bacterium]|nr:transporter substrate-binding protein [Betaproteobacteria bacterium]
MQFTQTLMGLAYIGLVMAGSPALAQTAQNYPVKTIRVVVPFPPGGTSDVLGRIVGIKLTEKWGQQILIESRAGAGGMIGTELVARAQPDGYTLLLSDMRSIMIANLLHPKPTFDYIRDFAPVMEMSYSPHLLGTHPSLPVKNVKELIALAKKRPGELNFAAAIAGAPQLAGVEFANRAGIRWTYIIGRGGMQTVMDVVSGQADVMFNGMLATLPQVQSGRLKLLAVTSAKRVASLPDTPTIAESGMPGFVTGSWQGILAPAGTPPEILAKIHAEISRILSTPDIKEKLMAQGAEPLNTPPAETAKSLREERDRLVKLFQDTGYKGQQ